MNDMPSSDRSPRWTLHVRHGSTSTLVYGLAAGAGDRIAQSAVPPLEVALPPALTGFVLALFAARALDERHASDESGGDARCGARSLNELGKLLAAVPGPGNRVEADTVGGYKRGLARRTRAAVREWQARTGVELTPDPLVVQPGYGRGYALGPRDLPLDGIDVEALLAAVDPLDRPHRPAATRPGAHSA